MGGHPTFKENSFHTFTLTAIKQDEVAGWHYGVAASQLQDPWLHPEPRLLPV